MIFCGISCWRRRLQPDNGGRAPRRDPDLKVRTALDRAAERIQGKFAMQPEVEASIRTTIGQTYEELGLFPEARKQLERALELESRVLGAENPKTLSTMNLLGWTAKLQGQYPEAEALLNQTLATRRRVLGPEHRDTLMSMNIWPYSMSRRASTPRPRRLTTRLSRFGVAS